MACNAFIPSTAFRVGSEWRGSRHFWRIWENISPFIDSKSGGWGWRRPPRSRVLKDRSRAIEKTVNLSITGSCNCRLTGWGEGRSDEMRTEPNASGAALSGVQQRFLPPRCISVIRSYPYSMPFPSYITGKQRRVIMISELLACNRDSWKIDTISLWFGIFMRLDDINFFDILGFRNTNVLS